MSPRPGGRGPAPAAVPALGVGRWLTAKAGERALAILMAAGPDSPLAEVELRHVAAARSGVPGAETSCPGEVLLHATGPVPDADTRSRVEAALDTVLAAARGVDTGRGAAAFRDGQTSTPDALPPAEFTRVETVRSEVDPDRVVAPSPILR